MSAFKKLGGAGENILVDDGTDVTIKYSTRNFDIQDGKFKSGSVFEIFKSGVDFILQSLSATGKIILKLGDNAGATSHQIVTSSDKVAHKVNSDGTIESGFDDVDCIEELKDSLGDTQIELNASDSAISLRKTTAPTNYADFIRTYFSSVDNKLHGIKPDGTDIIISNEDYNRVIINTVDDFPGTPSGGHLHINGSVELYINQDVVIPFSLSGENLIVTGNGRLIKFGGGYVFENLNLGDSFLLLQNLVIIGSDGIGGVARVFNVDSTVPGGGDVLANTCAFAACQDLGKLKGISFSLVNNKVIQCNGGITLENITRGIVNTLDTSLMNNNVGNVFFTIQGNNQKLNFTNSFTTPQSNQTVFDIKPDSTVISASVTNNNVDLVSGGGYLFAPFSKKQDDPNWYFDNVGAENSDNTASGNILNNAVATTISAVSTPTPINGIWNLKEFLERIVFQDVCTFNSTNDTLLTTFNHGLNAVTRTATTISFSGNTILDSGGGFLTAGFKKGDIVTITNSVSNNVVVEIDDVNAGVITTRYTFVTESEGANITIVKQSKIRLKTYSGTFPPELNQTTDYYCITDTSASVKLSLTRGGSAVNFTTNGSGTLYYRHMTGKSASGWVISTSINAVKYKVSGWISMLAGATGDNVRGHVMKSNSSGVISHHENGSTVNASTTDVGSSNVDSIIRLEKEEGFLFYISNEKNDNDLTVKDAIMNLI